MPFTLNSISVGGVLLPLGLPASTLAALLGGDTRPPEALRTLALEAPCHLFAANRGPALAPPRQLRVWLGTAR